MDKGDIMLRNEDWICYRPSYHFRRLEYDLVKSGYEDLPRTIFGQQSALTLLDDSGRIWITGLPTPQEILTRLLENKDYFDKIHRMRNVLRQEAFKYVTFIRSILESNLSINQLVWELERYKNFLTQYLPYIIVVSLIDNLAINDFIDFLRLQTFGIPVERYVVSLLTSPWAERCIVQEVYPPSDKTLTIPAPPLFIIDDFGFIIEEQHSKHLLDIDVYKSIAPSFREQYKRKRYVVPILAQWGDENLYLMSSIRTHFNKLLEQLADKLLNGKMIPNKESILDLDLMTVKTIQEK